jgi:uncharacterized oligopeptide transporter (OPT) family protein
MVGKEFVPEENGGSGLTFRAVLIAVFLAVFLLFVSSYVALKVGALPWPIVFSAIVAGFLVKISSVFFGSGNKHELNVAQAGGTIGGLLASGIVFTIPGILYLQSKGFEVKLPGVLELAVLGVCAGVLGVLLSVPLRRVFVDELDLPYPSGSAGAEVIRAQSDIGKNTFFLFLAVSLSGLFVLFRDNFFANGFLVSVYPQLGLEFLLYPMPLAVCVGFILGKKAGFNSWFFGSFFGWLILIPVLVLLNAFPLSESIGLIQGLGMGLVIGSGIGFFVSYVLPRAEKIFFPLLKWVGVPWYWKFLPLFSIVSFFALYLIGVPIVVAAIAVLGVWMMVSVSAMMTGETDIDPLEQFGLIIGLVAIGFFSVFGLNVDYYSVFLVVCFVSIASAIAGDIGHDYKSAKIIGTKPKDILIVDLIAVVVAGLLAPFVFQGILKVYAGEFFTSSMPAPQAQIVASAISGFQNFFVFLFGFFVAFIWVLFENIFNKKTPVLPMVFGIGFFLGPTLGILLGIGGLLRDFVEKKFNYLVGVGLIISAGVMGGETISGIVSKVMLISGYGAYSFPLLLVLFVLFFVFALNLRRAI